MGIWPVWNVRCWPDDVWDMNEQVMMWLAPASNRPEISQPVLKYLESGQGRTGSYNGGKVGGEWMIHNYVKIQDHGNLTHSTAATLAMVADALPKSSATLGGLAKDNHYHLTDCGSPEYRCFPPFDSDPTRQPQCKIQQDCNYGLSQLRWGLDTAGVELGALTNDQKHGGLNFKTS